MEWRWWMSGSFMVGYYHGVVGAGPRACPGGTSQNGGQTTPPVSAGGVYPAPILVDISVNVSLDMDVMFSIVVLVLALIVFSHFCAPEHDKTHCPITSSFLILGASIFSVVHT